MGGGFAQEDTARYNITTVPDQPATTHADVFVKKDALKRPLNYLKPVAELDVCAFDAVFPKLRF